MVRSAYHQLYFIIAIYITCHLKNIKIFQLIHFINIVIFYSFSTVRQGEIHIRKFPNFTLTLKLVMLGIDFQCFFDFFCVCFFVFFCVSLMFWLLKTFCFYFSEVNTSDFLTRLAILSVSR